MALSDWGRPADPSSVVDLASMYARVRFVMLWLVAGAALAGTMAVFFYEPGVLEDGVAGEMEGDPVTTGMALMTAAMVALPLILATVTLFLPARAGAVTSLVAGVPLGAFGVFAVVTHVADGSWPPHLTLAVLAAAVAWLIVGLSVAELRRVPAGRRSAGVGAGRSDGARTPGRPLGPRSTSPRGSSGAARRRSRAGSSR